MFSVSSISEATVGGAHDPELEPRGQERAEQEVVLVVNIVVSGTQ